MAGKIFNIGHRGFSAQYPENTITAFRKAAEAGADMVELDVSNSKDMAIVTLHDDALDRTTNGSGRVSAHTLAEIKRLDAGSWFAPEFAGERIPTLDEIFQALRDTDLRFCIEIKKLDEGVDPHPVVEKIIQIVDAEGMRQRSILIGFEAGYLALAKQIDPLIPTGYNPGDYESQSAWQVVEATLTINADLIIPRYDWLTPEFVNDLHAAGIPLWPWTVNEEADLRTVLAAGVDGVITNHPDRLSVILSEG